MNPEEEMLQFRASYDVTFFWNKERERDQSCGYQTWRWGGLWRKELRPQCEALRPQNAADGKQTATGAAVGDLGVLFRDEILRVLILRRILFPFHFYCIYMRKWMLVRLLESFHL